MSLKYVSTPQLNYRGDGSKYDFGSRFPSNMQPIATCPDHPVFVCEANGYQHYGIKHRDSFQKLEVVEGYGPMMRGEISNPVGWVPVARK